MTDNKIYTANVCSVKITQILHLWNGLDILPITHLLANSQLLIASIKNRIDHQTVVVQIGTKYYLPAPIAGDGKIHMNNEPTAEMLASSITKPFPRSTVFKQCTTM